MPGPCCSTPSTTGPLIISFAPAAYPVEEIALGAGDRIVLYTDGVTEAMRRDGDMFGIERLSAVVGAPRDGPGALLSAIMVAVTEFADRRDAPLDDDCTLVALEVG